MHLYLFCVHKSFFKEARQSADDSGQDPTDTSIFNPAMRIGKSIFLKITNFLCSTLFRSHSSFIINQVFFHPLRKILCTKEIGFVVC